ncbi:MAG: hypothetical protein ACRC6M_06785, partial [Microcystaceae cyanobacterium]
MNSRHWLNWTEYTALFASIAGTIATVITQQVVWVTSPLIVTLGLSLINRQRELKSFQEFVDHKDVIEDLNTRRINQLEMTMTDLQAVSKPENRISLDQLQLRLQHLEQIIQQSQP